MDNFNLGIKHYIHVYNMSCFYHSNKLSTASLAVLAISTIITGKGSCVCRSTALNYGEHITFSIFPRTKNKFFFKAVAKQPVTSKSDCRNALPMIPLNSKYMEKKN